MDAKLAFAFVALLALSPFDSVYSQQADGRRPPRTSSSSSTQSRVHVYPLGRIGAIELGAEVSGMGFTQW